MQWIVSGGRVANSLTGIATDYGGSKSAKYLHFAAQYLGKTRIRILGKLFPKFSIAIRLKLYYSMRDFVFLLSEHEGVEKML